EAVADGDQALKLDPNSALARLNRGKAHQAKGNNDQAIVDLTRAIRDADSLRAPEQGFTAASVSPNARLAEAYLARGKAYRAKNDNDTAIADFTQATQLDPSNPFPYAARAYAYTAKHEYDRAITDWDGLIARAPDIGGLYRERGLNYFAK